MTPENGDPERGGVAESLKELGRTNLGVVGFAGRRVLGVDETGGNMFKEFKEFVMRGNVFDMAVGIIIGGAFGPIVKALVDEILMPPIGMLIGGVDFSNIYFVLKAGAANPGPYANLAAAREAGAVALGIGVFLNTIISFLIVAGAVFMLVKTVNRLKREAPAPAAAPTTRDCPECLMSIPIAARKCGHCGSAVGK